MGGTPAATPELLEETLKVLAENGGNISAAAESIGVSRCTFASRVYRARSTPIPPEETFRIKGTSTLYDPDGNVKIEWVKTEVDKERAEALAKVAILALMEGIKPTPKTPSPKKTDSDLLVALMIGDAHLGCYAWGDQCSGGSTDTDIASRDLILAADRLIASTPDAGEGLIVNLGDWFHADNLASTTTAGTTLDTDGRRARTVRIGVQVLRHIVSKALEKFKTVRLRNVKGNHDQNAGLILDEAMRAFYAKDTRFILEDTPADLFIHRFGTNLIGITHGHNVKMEALPGVLAVDAREHWSDCEFRYIWTGHVHNRRCIEAMETLCESFRTLQSNDKWHSDKGYRSQKEMVAIVLDRNFGEVERHTAGLKRVRAGQ